MKKTASAAVPDYSPWGKRRRSSVPSQTSVSLIVIAANNWHGNFNNHPCSLIYDDEENIVMIWSFDVMVTWRHRSNFLADQWGTLNYQEEEVTKPDFRGTNQSTIFFHLLLSVALPLLRRLLYLCQQGKEKCKIVNTILSKTLTDKYTPEYILAQ